MKTETEQSKISNSLIGSHHWAATLLSYVMRVGEYLADHEGSGIKPAERIHYQSWGEQLKRNAIEVNDYLHTLPDVDTEFVDRRFKEGFVSIKQIQELPSLLQERDTLREANKELIESDKERLIILGEYESALLTAKSYLESFKDQWKEGEEFLHHTISSAIRG